MKVAELEALILNHETGAFNRAPTDREWSLIHYGDTSFIVRDDFGAAIVIGGTAYYRCHVCGVWFRAPRVYIGRYGCNRGYVCLSVSCASACKAETTS